MRYWARVVAEMAEACETAAKLDITLAVEMHSDTVTDTSKSTLALLRDVGAPNLKVNYQCSSGVPPEDPYRRLEAVLPHVANVHAQNYASVAANPETRPSRVALTDGTVDYRRLAAMLAKSGYGGYIEVEFAPDANPDKNAALRADYEFLRSLCQ
jgi:sugar phosphate isomerase/epimerase